MTAELRAQLQCRDKAAQKMYLWMVRVNQLEGIGETLEDTSFFHNAQHLASQTRR